MAVQSVKDFLEAVWAIAPPMDGKRLFRGQAENWPLLPKLYRTNKLVHELGALEKRLTKAFEARCLYLMPSVPDNIYDRWSLAQHFGLPTRLLDWSTNPLMALYFAVESGTPPHPTVHIFDATKEQLDITRNENIITDFPITKALKPIPHSHRVVSQAGYHTLHSLPIEKEEQMGVVAMTATEDKHRLMVCVWPTQVAGSANRFNSDEQGVPLEMFTRGGGPTAGKGLV